MILTNKFNLPQPIVRLVERQAYSRGRAHMSVTDLITPPQIVALRRQHRHEMEEDVSERFWAAMGSNIHSLLEAAADSDHLTEERLFIDCAGWTISGQIDVQNHAGGGIAVSDYKFTNVFSILYPKPEWERQLNLYAYLVQAVKGVHVTSASVVAILRDWRKSSVARTRNYPATPIIVVDIPLWPIEVQAKYLHERVVLHQEAMRTYDWHDRLPPCSDEDRWARNGGDAIRCKENYCGVAPFCSQWNAENICHQPNNIPDNGGAQDVQPTKRRRTHGLRRGKAAC